MLKLVVSNLLERRMPKMHPYVESPQLTIRRDSGLVADLEELHLKIMHEYIVKLIHPLKTRVNYLHGKNRENFNNKLISCQGIPH